MKKYMVMFAAASVLACVAGCSNGGDNGGTYSTDVSSIVFDDYEVFMRKGETLQLSVSVYPEYAEDKSVEWNSTDESIAIVNGDGNVVALKVGTVTITAKAGGKYATCELTVLEDLAIGDYYFSDGTYSKHWPEGKTPIGVVFWVGDPTLQDPTLNRDFPDCTHGLVVSLHPEIWCASQPGYREYDATVSSWISNNAKEYLPIITGKKLDDDLNKILGYNNTKAIEAFNAAPANKDWPVVPVQKTVAYRAEVAAPESSSGWYLPSAKELSLLCSGEVEKSIADLNMDDAKIDTRIIVDNTLITIPGMLVLTSTGAWSSSEYDSNCFYAVGLSIGNAYEAIKYADYVGLRYVLAF